MMMDTFESLLATLSHAQIDFIVVGGLAVAVAGFTRATVDVDILIDASEGNVRRLLECLQSFGSGAASELSPDDFPLEEGCVRIAEDFDLDIFTMMSGNTFNDLRPQTITQPVLGEPVRFLNAEALLNLKADSLRPKDQLDVQALREILRRPKN